MFNHVLKARTRIHRLGRFSRMSAISTSPNMKLGGPASSAAIVRQLMNLATRMEEIKKRTKEFYKKTSKDVEDISCEIGQLTNLVVGMDGVGARVPSAAVKRKPENSVDTADNQEKKKKANSIEEDFMFDDWDGFSDLVEDDNKQANKEKIPVRSQSVSDHLKPISDHAGKISTETANVKIDNDGYAHVFTDGACSANGRVGSKAGVGVWWGDNSRLNVARPVVGDRHTNNTAEIQAATIAISQAKALQIKKIAIYTDSQFLINCVTKWMPNWKRNSWRTKDGKPVKNREDLEALDAEITNGKMQVRWEHVRGHSGIKGNEKADALARQGAAQVL